MAGQRILLIQGHPDAVAPHLCHTLAEAYAEGAQAAGHDVRWADVAKLDFPLLRSQQAWEHSALPAALQTAQDDMAWAEHLVLFFPLWLGDMPALLKGFLEQVARPGFAFKAENSNGGGNPFGHKGLAGRSARVVVTMGMPAMVYRWYFRAHSLKSLERNILGFVGIAPVNETLIGMVDKLGEAGVKKWQGKMRVLGRAAS
ncbi:MAG: dehydrogenase [Curvibacter sp. GWA2_64_110]|nr:MAG: dehydrogenase [Curvibacter sp. GWA2_64_110]HCY17108.1 dehydrogenase [Curvibacter sp.]